MKSKTNYASSTITSYMLGWPKAITNTKGFAKRQHGALEWRMYESRKMITMVKINKILMRILSTHKPLLEVDGS